MKIETMMRALTMAQLAWHHPGDYRMRTRLDWFEMVQRIFAGIMRRYIRLQQENAMLRDEVAFWKAEALKDGDHA